MFLSQNQQQNFNDFKEGKSKFYLNRCGNCYIEPYLNDDFYGEDNSCSVYFIINNVLYEINTCRYKKEDFYITSFDDQLEINQLILVAILIHDVNFEEFNQHELDGKKITKEIVSNWYFDN